MAVELKTDLVARELRHDVRNQLFALRTTLAVLQQSASNPVRLEQSLTFCASVLDRLVQQVEEYFACATGEATNAPVALDQTLGDAVQGVSGAAEALGIELKLEFRPVTLSTRPVLLAMAFRHVLRALARLATKQIRILLRPLQRGAEITFRYSPREQLDPQARAEAQTDLKVARQCLAPSGGVLKIASELLTVTICQEPSPPRARRRR